jgi:hypothetical protein
MKQLNLVFKLETAMTDNEREISFVIFWNGIIDSRLPFMSGNQQYFQNQSCSVNTIPHTTPSHSIPFILS